MSFPLLQRFSSEAGGGADRKTGRRLLNGSTSSSSSTMAECWSLCSELYLSCARPVADG